MASKLDSCYEAEEIVRMDIDLEIGQGTIGLFTIDLTTNPSIMMGYIRREIGAALGISQDVFTIKNDKTIVPDSYIAKNYLEEIKGLYNGNLLRLDIDEDKQRDVAMKLLSRLNEHKDVIGRSIIIEELSEDKQIILTIYKPCFNLYVSKFL